MRDKPTRWGFKTFLLCYAHDGYVIKFQFFEGEKYPNSNHKRFTRRFLTLELS